MVSAVSQKPALVHKRECVISKSRDIATTAFGPAYVLTGHDPKTKYSFLACIDDMTQVATVANIFHTLMKLGVNIKDLTKVRLMGGWKDHRESAKCGGKIIQVLKSLDVPEPNLKYYQQKKTIESNEKCTTVAEALPFYYLGRMLSAADAKFRFFNTIWKKQEDLVLAKDKEDVMKLICAKYPQYRSLVASDPQMYKVLGSQMLMNEPEIPLTITVVD